MKTLGLTFQQYRWHLKERFYTHLLGYSPIVHFGRISYSIWSLDQYSNLCLAERLKMQTSNERLDNWLPIFYAMTDVEDKLLVRSK
jgi:hypothetical protein